jgi:hypothetical protein
VRATKLLPTVIALTALAGCTTVAACGTQEAGSPTARSSATTTPTVAGQQTTTSPSTSSGVVIADPCALLDSEALAQLGYAGQGDKKTANGAVTCIWAKPEGSIEVTLSPRGVDELNLGSATKVEPTMIGGHAGKRVEELNGVVGDCSFSLAISSRSSVSVGVFMAGETAQACAQAEQAAKLVEPKLPRG